MVKKSKNNKVSTLKSWSECKHTPKETRKLRDLSDDTEYEICDKCGISRRVK